MKRKEKLNNNGNGSVCVPKRVFGKKTMAEKAAEFFSKAVGSWKFIIIQSVFIIIWAMLNVYGIIAGWDPYPFIFLNLLLSVQAAYATPIILMSQNRETERDRQRLINDLATTRKAEREIQQIQVMLKRLEEKIDQRGVSFAEKKKNA